MFFENKIDENKIINKFLLKKSSKGKKPNIELAKKMLEHHKSDILDVYSKQNYDNYVTGGGTVKTDKHYSERFDKYHNMGLYWNIVYGKEEVDRNIV